MIVLGGAAGQLEDERGVALVRCLATGAQPSAHVSPTVTCFDRVAHEDNKPPIGLVPEVAEQVQGTARLRQLDSASLGKMFHRHGQS